jgi:NAD(P)-dependent dehydrogenase (short-subunit alcohol dehydrogenase family)
MYDHAPEGLSAQLRPWQQTTPLAAVTEEKDGKDAVERVSVAGGRAATVEEIAKIVGMGCSEESGWCTGSTISANGGMIFSLKILHAMKPWA